MLSCRFRIGRHIKASRVSRHRQRISSSASWSPSQQLQTSMLHRRGATWGTHQLPQCLAAHETISDARNIGSCLSKSVPMNCYVEPFSDDLKR